MNVLESGFERARPPEGNRFSGGADLAMLTHDIRSALSGVLGGIALIDTSTLSAENNLQVERARAAARMLASLVTQVMADDAEGESSDPLRHGTDLRDFRDFLIQRWKGDAVSRGIAFEVVAGPDLPAALDCPAIDLSRMIGNLVSNSIRHVRTGGVTVSFERAAQGGLDITISDTGPGVNDSVLRTVARPGFGNPLSVDEKHGLGLQIVKAIATELGGRFSLRNGVERGLVAAIWLPERLLRGGDDARAQAARAPALFPALAGKRILLAEDNPTNQMVASQMLDALHAEVTLASDGVEALEAFAEGEFDLVVVDIEMPRLSGIDVIRAIRAQPAPRSQVPIVALTAYALREHRDRIAVAGADGLISKPIIGIAELGRNLSAHLAAPGETRARPEPEAAKAPTAVPDAIDLEIYDALVKAIGAEMRDELLDKVLADLLATQQDLEAALETGDLKPIRAASHILISVGGAVGATRLLAAARAVNACAHDSDLARLAEELRICLRELDHAVAFVREERGKARG